MKIIYVHHGNRAIKGKATQEDDLTDLGYRDCNLVAELLNNEKSKIILKQFILQISLGVLKRLK